SCPNKETEALNPCESALADVPALKQTSSPKSKEFPHAFIGLKQSGFVKNTIPHFCGRTGHKCYCPAGRRSRGVYWQRGFLPNARSGSWEFRHHRTASRH